MLTRFHIRPVAVAIAGGIVMSLAAFWGLARLAHPPAGSVDTVAPPVLIRAIRQTPRALPLPVAARTFGNVSSVTQTANVARTDAPLPLVHPPSQPSQLIRTSTLGIEVKDVSRAVKVATGIVAGELGDVVNLDYRAAGETDTAKTATLEVRVPQYRFNHAVEELSALGRVTSRAESAQDAAGQIVDAQARLRNLRHTEADISRSWTATATSSRCCG